MNTILKPFRFVTLALLVLLGSSQVFTQTALTQTTTSSAVTVGATTVVVASATGFLANDVLYIDKEAFKVATSYSSGTTIPVIRGQGGTTAARHASGAVVFRGLPSYFYGTDVAGPCTRTAEVALPHINLASGNIFDCQNSTWNLWALGGQPVFSPLGTYTGQLYTSTATSAAITIQPGVSFIGSGGALNMTLANPTLAQNGMIMVIEASTAQAHTVTYTAGFNGGTTARDVATYGGAIGDNMVIFANNQVWWVISTRNVTFG